MLTVSEKLRRELTAQGVEAQRCPFCSEAPYVDWNGVSCSNEHCRLSRVALRPSCGTLAGAVEAWNEIGRRCW